MTIYLSGNTGEGGGVNTPLYLKVKVIQTVDDFPATIEADVDYQIDGKIDMGTRSLEIPAGGITISGFGLKTSSLYSTENNYTLFTSPVGGSGDFDIENLVISTTGSGSKVFDIKSDDGFKALEFIKVNFEDCTSLGVIDNYRQGFESGTARLGATPELTLEGEWVGGYRITSSIIRNIDSGFTGSIFKAGGTFEMNNRFLTDALCDLPDNASSFADFSPSNFTQPSLVQVVGSTMTRDGLLQSDSGGFFPNLLPSDLVCSWKGNVGLVNTHVGGRLQVSSQAITSIAASSTYYDFAGTFTADNLEHFTSPSSGQLRHDGITPTQFMLIGSLTVEGGANDQLGVKIVKWDNSASVFVDIYTQLSTITSNIGPRDVTFISLYYPVMLDQNDYVKLQIANLSDTTNMTLETSSFFQLYEQ